MCPCPPPPQEGDHIGLTRKANNALHFYINGVDQGGDIGGGGGNQGGLEETGTPGVWWDL